MHSALLRPQDTSLRPIFTIDGDGRIEVRTLTADGIVHVEPNRSRGPHHCSLICRLQEI